MESVYIESTIPSFLTARRNENPSAMWKKDRTKVWWTQKKGLYQKSLFDYCRFNDLHMPVLCTPADFLPEEET